MNQRILESLRKQYPVGARVELVKMDDSQAPPIGTKGTVIGVDDIGSVIVKWDNGCSLNVVYGEDVVNVINEGNRCPKCGEIYHDRPAISRIDNITLICPVCGTREALECLGMEEDKINEIVSKIPKIDK